MVWRGECDGVGGVMVWRGGFDCDGMEGRV